jgi:hypothetical protein
MTTFGGRMAASAEPIAKNNDPQTENKVLNTTERGKFKGRIIVRHVLPVNIRFSFAVRDDLTGPRGENGRLRLLSSRNEIESAEIY